MFISAILLICNHCDAPHVPFTLAIISLEERPVTVNVLFDDYIEPCPEDPFYQFGPWSLSSMFCLLHKETGEPWFPEGLKEILM